VSLCQVDYPCMGRPQVSDAGDLSSHMDGSWGYNEEGLISHEPPRRGGPIAWLLDEGLKIPR
jgi:hypothetical protein